MTRTDPLELGDRLIELGHNLKTHGDAYLTKSHEWTYGPRKVPASGERGGGLAEAQPEDSKKEAVEDRRAAKVHARYLTALATLRAAALAVDTLHQVIHPGQPRILQHSDMTASQLVADGWCPSCFRNSQHFNPVAAGRYTDRCRPCGDYRHREHQDPPVDILRLMHQGKSLRERVST